MLTLRLEGAAWRTADDFYDSFLEVVGAPSWHGRNLDALNDTMRGDDINTVRLPYAIVLNGTSRMGASALATVERFRDLIDDLRKSGKEISIELLD